MNNLNTSYWARCALAQLPESYHQSIKQIAKYALDYKQGNRLTRRRRPATRKAATWEIPAGLYIEGMGNSNWQEDDKFFADLHLLYRNGWLEELDRSSLALTIGPDFYPATRYGMGRRRDVIIAVKRYAVYARDNYMCWICGFETLPIDSEDRASGWYPSLDHVKPHSHGGGDTMENLRTAHRWCNTAKGDRAFSAQIMQARVNCRMSLIAMLWEALVEGWDYPESDLDVFSRVERHEFVVRRKLLSGVS